MQWLSYQVLVLVVLNVIYETPFMPFRMILVIEWQHNTWTNMIVKMTILRLLGSSDEYRCIRWLSEEPTPWYFGAEGIRSQVNL